jgi:hypothetical protein
MELLHRRTDGTFVITYNGKPYHVTQDDPLFTEVATAAVGVDLPPEPGPPAEVVLPQPPQPTRAQLMARLAELQAQIEALPE